MNGIQLKIGKVSFFNPERQAKSKTANISTMGLSILTALLKERGLKCNDATEESARYFDVLLITLYWWKDVYSLHKFIQKAKINLQKRKPLVICGGISALNPCVIKDACHYVFIGDIEDRIDEFTAAIQGKTEWEEVPGIYDFKKQSVTLQTASKICPIVHTENRQKAVSRIEIARGCTNQCRFCVIGNYKPYVEQPFEVIKKLHPFRYSKNTWLVCT